MKKACPVYQEYVEKETDSKSDSTQKSVSKSKKIKFFPFRHFSMSIKKILTSIFEVLVVDLLGSVIFS